MAISSKDISPQPLTLIIPTFFASVVDQLMLRWVIQGHSGTLVVLPDSNYFD